MTENPESLTALQAENAALKEEISILKQRIATLEEENRELEQPTDSQTAVRMTSYQARATLRVLVDNVPGFIFVKDCNFRYLLANSDIAQGVGSTPGAMLGKDDWEVGFPEELIMGDAEKGIRGFRTDDQAVIASGETILNPYDPALFEDGMHVFDTKKIPLYDEDGTLFGVLGIAQDITRQHRSEERQQELQQELYEANLQLEQRVIERTQELRQSQALLKGIVDNIPAVVYINDREGYYTLANEFFASLLDMKVEEIIGKRMQDLIPSDILEELWSRHTRVLESGQPLTSEQAAVVDNTAHTFLDVRFPIFDAEGNISGVGGFSTDITERKEAEDALRSFKLMAENSPIAIARGDLNAIMDFTNPAFSALLGSSDSLVGRGFLDIFPEDLRSAALEAVQATAEQGEWQGILTFERLDGVRIDVHSTGYLIKDIQDQPFGLVGMFQDISAQQQAEQERAEMQEQVIEAQRAAIRELSTPLIPLSSHVVLMPLVGNIDSNRAQQVMENLLEGIASYQADTAILDITGVSVVDTQVANALIQAAQAVKLLGAQVVLTGIGPTMAQTLVHLGADLSSIQTRGNLQGAVIDALKE
jgi:PAS domain S-box-containing protein